MKKTLVAGLFVLAFAMPAFAGEAKQDFTLVNDTGYELSEVYVSPARAEDWGDDVMGPDAVEDGDAVPITFHRANKTCQWDLKVVYTEDGSHAIWSDIDLCTISKITIHYNRKADKTSASYE